MAKVVYCVTVSINRELVEDWLNWMRQVHIRDVLKTGCFTSHRLLELQTEDTQPQVQFLIQYDCESKEVLTEYWREHASAIQAEHTRRYGGQFHARRDVFRVIE